MKNIKDLFLVEDWDHQPKIGDSKIGHHILRIKEHSILMDFLTRRNEGSFLLCGHRGTGKTSSLFSAINEAQTKRKTLLPILIKATSIQFESEKEQESIVKHLIYSLHRTIKHDNNSSDDFKKRVEELHKNSLASKKGKQYSANEEKGKEYSASIKFNLIPPIVLIIASLAFLTAGSSPHAWILSVISSVLGGIFVISFISKKWFKSSESSSSYYIHEYTFENLLSELEELLDNYSNERKILFILDEFDKTKETQNVLPKLKMLLNQNNTLFLFITVPDILDKLENRNDPEYTLFSQVLFLKRPLFKEMKSFLDNICDFANSTCKKEDQDYKMMKNYLCYMSGTNFFRLYSQIRDVVSNKGDKQCLDIHLVNSHITKANLQQCIEWIYSRKQRHSPSQWQTNDQILDALYDFTAVLENTPKNESVSIADDGATFTIGTTGTYNPQGNQHSTIMDLLNLLTKQGYLRHISDQTCSIVGNLPVFHTDLAGIFVEEQRVLKNAYEDFRRQIVSFANLKTRYVDDAGTPFDTDAFEAKWDQIHLCLAPFPIDFESCKTARDFHDQIASANSPIIPTEQLQEQSNILRHALYVLNRSYVDLLSQIFTKALKMEIQGPYSDISNGFFSTLGIPNTNLTNTTLRFTLENKLFKNIVIAFEPTDEFLDSVKSKNITNNMIICLGDPSQASQYERRSFVITESAHLKNVIKKIPLKGKDDHEIIFYFMKLPLHSSDVEKILQVICDLFQKNDSSNKVML